MVNEQLLNYIKQQLQLGINKELIRSSLITNGWQSQDIAEAFQLFSFPDPLPPRDSSLSQTLSPQSPKKFNKIFLIAICVVGGVLVIGGGAFAYMNFFQSPEAILQKMFSKIPEIKTLEYSGEMKIEANAGNVLGDEMNFSTTSQAVSDGSKDNFSITFAGAWDMQSLENLKGRHMFNLKTNALSDSKEEFSLGLEARMLGKIFYAKLSDIPDLGFVDLSSLENQWIKVDSEGLRKQFELEFPKEEIPATSTISTLSPEKGEKLKTAFKNAKLFKITETLPSERLEGVDTYHYKFIFEREGIKNFFIEVGTIIQDKPMTEEELTAFDKNFDAGKVPDGEIWIGKNDLFPHKLSLNLAADKTNSTGIAGNVVLVVSLKNFNQPVEVETPAESTPVEDLLGGFLGGSGGTGFEDFSSSTSQDFEKDTDNDGLPDQVELMYGTNPNKADTDGDGFKDGEEVEKGFNPNGPGKLFQ
jgi:hypothetical protein